MTSESQERMLAIVTPSDLDDTLALCAKWGVSASVVGRVTGAAGDVGRLRILDGWDGPVLADVPAVSLHDGAPLYDRPMSPMPPRDPIQTRPDPVDCTDALLAMIVDPAWVYRQYDHQLFLNTVTGPGGDAAVLRLKAPGVPRSRRGVAISTDGNGRWCAVDPFGGAAMTVAEATLNVACAGARPAALVNCLNFGNPEHPEVMWQLSQAIDGMAAACRSLGVPVVGGNVSLYNESRGRDIDPTPVIGVLGIIDELDDAPPTGVLRPGAPVLLLGDPAADGLGGSRWARAAGDDGGPLPDLDLELHGRLLELVQRLVVEQLVDGIQDVSEGGLGVTLAEMAARAGVGCVVQSPAGASGLFSEAPSRVVCCPAPGTEDQVTRRARAAGVPVTVLGRAGGDAFVIEGLVDVPVEVVQARRRGSLTSQLSAAG
jgi:phosphoribosylformylglycinamidine synthase